MDGFIVTKKGIGYQRINSTVNDFVLKKVNIDKLIKEVIRNYAKIMIRKKLSIKYEPSNYHVISDEKWLGFVLEQILSNAIKYSKSGTIEISVSALKECTIVIKDEGIGINTQDIPRVFEKGYTGYNGHSNKHSTGIGLYLCKQILNKLEHTIKIQSVVGEGTLVYICMSLEELDTSD